MQVNCFYRHSSVFIDETENLVPLCSYFVSNPVTGDKLTQQFPLTLNNSTSDGKDIHFRVKISGKSLGMGPVDYLWLDLPYFDDNLPLQDILGGQASIDILCLFNHPDCDVLIEPSYSNDDVISSVPSPSARDERAFIPLFKKRNDNNTSSGSNNSFEGSGETQQDYGATIQSVKKGASNLWKAVLSTAEKIQQTTLNNFSTTNSSFSADGDNANYLVAYENLSRISTLLSTTFADDLHNSILVKLYALQCLGAPAITVSNVESVQWKTAGWQTSHPKADLKSSGLLALQAMTYFSERYPKLASDMINRNKANTKAQYPFAIVGVNLTLLLADILQIRNDRCGLCFEITIFNL